MLVFRLKATSYTMGIRRSIVNYMDLKGQYFSNNNEYPLNLFTFEFDSNDCSFLFNGEKKTALIGQEISFEIAKDVVSLSGVKEKSIYQFKILPLELVPEAIDYYKDAYENNYFFDEVKGEFEYLLYLIYKSMNDNENANNWLELSKKVNFIPAIKNI